jgi:hypothetical protein
MSKYLFSCKLKIGADPGTNEGQDGSKMKEVKPQKAITGTKPDNNGRT